MKANLLCSLTAILSITGIELYALHQGVNGTALSGALVVIGVLGGASAKTLYDKIRKGVGSDASKE